MVNLTLEELRYYLCVDGDRDGNTDPQHEGAPTLNQTPDWEWGETPARGAVILCNNDNDGGPAHRDNSDGVVNPGNDATHELSPMIIRREGPATAPPAASNWQARLEVMGGHEDRVRILRALRGPPRPRTLL